jgi:hypothetical protein
VAQTVPILVGGMEPEHVDADRDNPGVAVVATG